LTSQRRRINLALILSVISGILILISGIVWLADPNLFNNIGLGEFDPNNSNGIFAVFGSNPPSTELLGGVTVLLAVIVFVGAYYVYLPAGYEAVGGIVVAVFSLICVITGGGFVVGTILGVIGGVLGILGTREPVEEAVIKPKDKDEHEKF